MSIETQITELVDALKLTAKEAMDVLEATEDATESDLAALGHNGVRDAAKDAHNIANNLLKRLGVDPVRKPAPEPEAIEPEPETHVSEDVLEEVEASLAEAKAKIDERPPAHEEPPASIADLFQPDMPLAPQALALQQLWVKLGHQVQRGEANPDQIRKHERLSSEIEFINRHAFEGV